ncbi:MAG: hypothetical protein HS113_16005 [Verrucomicrobiales bacterium]|nr:hypothetical protein [Verrucomicrobiales bacterium]
MASVGWSNQEGDCEALPRDAFFGSGAGHQILLVVPSLDLVVVRFGSLLDQVDSDPRSFHGRIAAISSNR